MLEDMLEDPLADVRLAHRRQGQREVVERDRQAHSRRQQRGKRFAVDRVKQCTLDRLVDVRHTGQRLRWIDDTRAERELLQTERLAGVQQQRWRAFVHRQDETRPAHAATLLMSKATLTVPSRPAWPAWSSASRQRSSG